MHSALLQAMRWRRRATWR